MKKILLALGILILIGGMYFITRVNGDDSKKSITLVLENETIEIVTKKNTLGDALEASNLKIKYSGSKTDQYGRMIESINDQKNNKNDGKFWTYESKNNKQCVKDTFCTGIDLLKINDGDIFNFKYDVFK